MASPLAFTQRAELNRKGNKLLRPVSHLIDPSKEYHFFRKIQHWTLEVDGLCYELSPDSKMKLKRSRFTTDMCKPRIDDAAAWHKVRKDHNIEPETRKIGQTTKTSAEIEAESGHSSSLRVLNTM